MAGPKVIYDLGSNNGDDIPYYLQKSDKVVAVEANPSLVSQIKLRFPQEIASRKLIVEHCALTTGTSSEQVTFYIHKNDHVLSQFPRPDDSNIDEFDKVLVESRSMRDIIDSHGDPYYMKIDLENYDHHILMELLRCNIVPKFLSAESHSIDVFSVLVSLGYKSFNLVNGSTIHKDYANHSIIVENGETSYTFPHHSAGPFGEDIKGPWMTPDNFFRRLAFEGLGWKDIHVTTAIAPDPDAVADKESYLRREGWMLCKDKLRDWAPGTFNALKSLKTRMRGA